MARANAPLRRIRLCTTEQSLTQPTCRRGGPYVFARHAPAHEEAVKSGDGDDQADLRQACAQFLKRDILACLPDGKDVCRTLFHPARAHIATLWLRGKVASLAPLCLPADRRRWSNAKTSSCSTAAQPVINRRQKSRTQIHRKGVSHPCRPPSPARILNQKSHPAGIPPRNSKRSKTALIYITPATTDKNSTTIFPISMATSAFCPSVRPRARPPKCSIGYSTRTRSSIPRNTLPIPAVRVITYLGCYPDRKAVHTQPAHPG